MNIKEINTDNLTIGDAKFLIEKANEVNALFGNGVIESKMIEVNGLDMFSEFIGKYVIIRSYNEGINAGYLEQADHTGCVLSQCRRLWKPISKDRSLSWYEGVAVSGLGEKSAVSGVVDNKIIVEKYSITPCTETAKLSIMEFKANETTY